MLEQVLIDSGFKNIRTFGKRKEYERTVGNHKMRVLPSKKSVLITYEYDKGIHRDMTSIRVQHDKAIQIVVAFDVMSEMYA
jgi:hypothetical protein